MRKLQKASLKKITKIVFQSYSRLMLKNLLKCFLLISKAFQHFALFENEFLITVNSFLVVTEINKISKADGKFDYYLISNKFSDFNKIEVSEVTKTDMNKIEQILNKKYEDDIFYIA